MPTCKEYTYHNSCVTYRPLISPLSVSQYLLHLAHLSFIKFPFESTLVAQYGPFPSAGVAHELYVLPLCLNGNTQS